MKAIFTTFAILISLFSGQAALAQDFLEEQEVLPELSTLSSCTGTSDAPSSLLSDQEYCLGESPFYWYESNPVWSGFVVGGSSDIYLEVKARITTPIDRSYSCGYGSWGAWVGLGGYHSSNLIQAGITNSPTTPGQYTFFIEYLNELNNNPPIFVQSQTFSPGADLLISVTYNKTTHKAMFYLMNYSTGNSYTRITNGDVSNYYDGSSAEWINEKNGSTLYNFGTFHWNEAQVKLLNGQWSDFGDQQGHGLRITNASGDILATPQFYPTTSTSFVDKFYQCN